MIELEKYLKVPYLTGGRTMEGLDCWGLVLLIRAEMGLMSMPDFGAVTRETVHRMQKAFTDGAYLLDRGEPVAGAIAAVFKGSVFVHVGLVVEIEGRLAVIETNPSGGVRWSFLTRFLSKYYKVVFYRDRSLPEQA